MVEDVRPISRSSPSTCWKIRYNSRNDTAEIMPGHWRSSITAGQRHVQHFWNPTVLTEVVPRALRTGNPTTLTWAHYLLGELVNDTDPTRAAAEYRAAAALAGSEPRWTALRRRRARRGRTVVPVDL